MDNIFTSAARNSTVTENGHYAKSSTGSALLDLYGQIGALRDADFDDRVWPLFESAVREDPLIATRIMFYGRDARGGTGERNLFRRWLTKAATFYPELVKPNIFLIPEYGRWDDLYALVDTPLYENAFAVIREQWYKDIAAANAGKPVSLLGKWLKSCNTSSADSCALGYVTRNMLNMTEREYRKTLTMLRNRIRIVETQMSQQKWGSIEYDKVPSRAGLIYRDAFKRHDAERYNEYIASVRRGEKKIHAAMNTPQDIVHAYLNQRHVDQTLEAMWQNLPDYVGTDENIMVMADVSGSMYGRPIEISVGLAMYFAQHNTGSFHNLFMTFESNPHFVSLKEDATLLDNINTTRSAPWGGSTNLNAACEYMLKFAKEHNVPDKDMPRRLIIISDMEIDGATRLSSYDPRTRRYQMANGMLHADELRMMYRTAGYTMPQVIYWNVQSRHDHFQTTSDKPGVMLASGSSPAVFEALIAMKDVEVTPYNAMMEVLNGPRYSPITVNRL